MAIDPVEGFEDVIPGAAAFADRFLDALQNQARAQKVGMEFARIQSKKGSGRPVLAADLSFSKGRIKGTPTKLTLTQSAPRLMLGGELFKFSRAAYTHEPAGQKTCSECVKLSTVDQIVVNEMLL